MATGLVYLTAVIDSVTLKLWAHKVAITLGASHALLGKIIRWWSDNGGEMKYELSI